MTLQEANTIESVLGYVMKERIGAGGYGEVWRVAAPGGIFKALKIIYGFHDENRAQRELKSLDRIKEVRHPFLLSLERIEVVDGRLVVITELAEKSLKDRFSECRAQGLPGIPREELIRYLSDAADVLDFISGFHSLQHLDIKPENLLLLGGHIKVGDFGLVKDVHDATQSVMAGLTPTYAPPELFDGKPSKSSDQYSLAIVYHEMLTGTRPFSGTTPAQLAAQHIQGRPQLSALPRGDQPVILRALSKSPALRYPDCRAMMDDLAGRIARSARRPGPGRAKSPPEPVGDGQIDTPSATLVIANSTAVGSLPAHAVRKLPNIAESETAAEVHPTLFIGVGQTATTILRQLRRRLHERLGSADDVPALRILCLDTDCRDLAAATVSGRSDSLTSHEVLPVPLRKPEEYRRDATMHLNWLSRRWIYNVPRSLQTEGLRPLGRLAFADHREKVFEELHRAIEQITLPEALAQTAETVELVPATSPRVFVVASIAGGVGSGMVLDLAYAARSVLLERGFPDDAVIGLLVFSTGRSATERDLTVINTYSCLSELHHFSHVSGFPGDDTCDLPAFLDGDPTFSQTYLVDIGEDLSQDEFEIASSSLAEYLYLNCATRCAGFFDTARGCEELTDKMMLRSLGVSQTAAVVGDVATMPASIVAHHLVSRWVEPNDLDATDTAPDAECERVWQALQLAPNTLIRRLADGVQQKTKTALEMLLDRATRSLRDSAWMLVAEGKANTLFRRLETVLDGLVGTAVPEGQLQLDVGCSEALESVAQETLEELTATVTSAVWNTLNQPGRRCANSQRLADTLAARLNLAIQEITDRGQHARAELQRLEHMFTASPVPSMDPHALAQQQSVFAEAISRYAGLRLQELISTHARRMLALLQARLAELGSNLQEIQHALSQMAARLQTWFVNQQRATCYGVSEEQRLISSLMLRQITSDLPRLRDEVDQALQQQFAAAQCSLREMVMREGTHAQSRMEAVILQAARSVIRERLRRTDLDRLFRESKMSKTEIAAWLQRELETATPRLLPRCGGASRLMIAVPEQSSTSEIASCIEEQFSETPAIVRATRGDIVVCYEVEQVPLVSVAANLINSRPDCADLVAHLHTRTDIAWTPLVCPE